MNVSLTIHHEDLILRPRKINQKIQTSKPGYIHQNWYFEHVPSLRALKLNCSINISPIVAIVQHYCWISKLFLRIQNQISSQMMRFRTQKNSPKMPLSYGLKFQLPSSLMRSLALGTKRVLFTLDKNAVKHTRRRGKTLRFV